MAIAKGVTAIGNPDQRRDLNCVEKSAGNYAYGNADGNGDRVAPS